MRKKLRAALLLIVLLCLFAPVARAVECPPDEHKYTETGRIPATPMEDGEIDFVCTVCGHEYTRTIFATDHLWGPWVTVQEPTCTQPGRRRRTCTRAQPHDEYSAIPALRHDHKEIRIEPSCEEAGLKTFTCTRCDDTYTERIAPLEHDYREADRIEPSCLEPGKIIFACTHDPEHGYEEPIEALGSHSFGEWYTQTPAGEETEGLEARGCTICDFEETRAFEALPATTAELPTELPTEPPRTIPVLDIVLISANVVSWGYFAFLLIPYFLCLLYARRRRKAQEERDALRKEVDERRAFKKLD